jgi:hypothetical protein
MTASLDSGRRSVAVTCRFKQRAHLVCDPSESESNCDVSGLRIRADVPTTHLLTLRLRVVEWTAIGDNWMAAQFTPTKGISACPSGMTLSTVSNKTWPNVEGTLNSWNRAKCNIASAGAVAHGSTQLNGKSIGIKKRLACMMVSYANFARNMEDSHAPRPPR